MQGRKLVRGIKNEFSFKNLLTYVIKNFVFLWFYDFIKECV